MNEHPDWEELNDLADDRLDQAARAAARDHLAVCADCRARFQRLTVLLEDARSLPASENDPEVWPGVSATIRARRRGDTYAISRPWWHSPRRLAAAALLLVGASSALTAVALRRGGAPTVAAMPRWQASEAAWRSNTDELQVLLAQRRGALPPSFVEALDRSLAAVDLAILEASDALAADPRNDDLLAALFMSYRRKVELLRRVEFFEARS